MGNFSPLTKYKPITYREIPTNSQLVASGICIYRFKRYETITQVAYLFQTKNLPHFDMPNRTTIFIKAGKIQYYYAFRLILYQSAPYKMGLGYLLMAHILFYRGGLF